MYIYGMYVRLDQYEDLVDMYVGAASVCVCAYVCTMCRELLVSLLLVSLLLVSLLLVSLLLVSCTMWREPHMSACICMSYEFRRANEIPKCEGLLKSCRSKTRERERDFIRKQCPKEWSKREKAREGKRDREREVEAVGEKGRGNGERQRERETERERDRERDTRRGGTETRTIVSSHK